MIRRPMFFFEGDGTGGGGGGEGAASTLLAGDPGAQPPSGGAPPAWSWAKEDGTLDPGWLGKLPGDLKDNASLKSIGSLPDLAKSYVETKKLIGTKLEMPGEGATPEQVASWRKTVGAPEKPEGYYGEGVKSLRPEAIPETMWDVESEKKFVALAHKHHLPPAAVKEILGFHAENVKAALDASTGQETAVLQAEQGKLRQAWGADFDSNLNTAARVAQTIGLDPKTHPIFTHADVVQAFAKMGKLMSEDKLVKGDSTGVSGSIQDRIRDITDMAGTSVLSREYRGEFGPERQLAAQEQLHQLYAAAGQK